MPAVAEAMGLKPAIRRVAPRRHWAWAMPWGRSTPIRPTGPSPIHPPYPDPLASGRRAVPYLRHIRRASRGRTFTVMLKDPRTGAGAADLIWVPEHDRLRGDNVIVTLTSPHRLSTARLAAARQAPPPALAGLGRPRAAVLVGGDSRHHRFTRADMSRLVQQLAALARSGVALMATTSRRTPPALHQALRDIVDASGGFLWDGKGNSSGDKGGGNPYIALLALADAVVVTADSTNMLSQAAATGGRCWFSGRAAAMPRSGP
jgi:mitochondrial fission protein ELM1